MREKFLQIFAAPAYIGENENSSHLGKFGLLEHWKRPDGPPKVGLQVGHWKLEEVPDELEKLRGNTGASGGGKSEWEVNHTIAILTKDILEKNGIIVDILPATIPESYWADVFISIHADGSEDPSKSGYKIAAPWRDYTGKAEKLADYIEKYYGESTLLPRDPKITTNMRGYYAFSFWRFRHAIHPMTTAAILETGFLTNASDRTLIVGDPLTSAEGLALGIIEYLRSENLFK